MIPYFNFHSLTIPNLSHLNGNCFFVFISNTPLEHSLATEDDDVILFVNDPQHTLKDYLKRHENGDGPLVNDIEKLRKRYKTDEDRSELLHQYGIFLDFARIAPMMQRLLGK